MKCLEFVQVFFKKNLDSLQMLNIRVLQVEKYWKCMQFFGVGCVLFRELPYVWALDTPVSAVIIHFL